MPISMSQKAHYVTQSSVYDCPMLGALSDRRIEKYRKAGFYGEVQTQQRKQKQKRTNKKAELDAFVKSLGL